MTAMWDLWGAVSYGPVLLIDAAVKGGVILLLAVSAALVLRRASAATRHAVWLLALASLLVLPVLSAALPTWRVLPHWADVSPPAAAAEIDAVAPAPDPVERAVPAAAPMPVAPAVPVVSRADGHAAVAPGPACPLSHMLTRLTSLRSLPIPAVCSHGFSSRGWPARLCAWRRLRWGRSGFGGWPHGRGASRTVPSPNTSDGPAPARD